MRIAGLVLAASVALGGCAAPGFVIHRMPPDTPAADNAVAIEGMQKLSMEKQEAPVETHGEAPAPPLTPADAPPMATYDPWERFNRLNYRFNAGFDEAVFLPVSNAYRRLPSPIRAGAHNFFANLSEIDSVINYTLQGRLGRGVRSLGRFVVNSTLGIGGLFDVAKGFHLPYAPTGFGTTLAKWGMHPGPYFVIPFLGPSTLRETVGLMGDFGTSYGINIANLYQGNASWGLGAGNAIDTRSNVSFRYYSTGSPFEYEDVRFLYVHKLLLQDEGLHRKIPRQTPRAVAPAGQ